MQDPEVGYVQGMNFLAGFIMHYIEDEGEAFALLERLMRHPVYHMRNFFLAGLPEIQILRHVVNAILKRYRWVTRLNMRVVIAKCFC